MSEAKALPDGWYVYNVLENACEDKPGIYEWRVLGYGSYIGKFKQITRPTRHYARNVTNLLNERPYRLRKPDGFRPIHKTLLEAVEKGRFIELIILENPSLDKIGEREQELIRERGHLNVPPYGGAPRERPALIETSADIEFPPDYIDGSNALLSDEDQLSDEELEAAREARFDQMSYEAWTRHRDNLRWWQRDLGEDA